MILKGGGIGKGSDAKVTFLPASRPANQTAKFAQRQKGETY